MAKEKCYPVSGFGNITICNNNKGGQCKLWNKKCDNIIMKNNREEKSKPIKKYTEEEQFERRQKDNAVIIGKKKEEKNTLAGWSKIIADSAKQAQEEKVKWQKEIGEPNQIIEIVDYKHDDKMIIHKLGFWKIEEGVLVIQINKRGPDPATQQIFTMEFIDKLVKTLEK